MLSEEQMLRYSRQLVLKGFGPRGQARLSQARVLVVGAGGLGSPALLYLAAAGVGCIGVADFDRVEPSNLQRQILFAEEDVGSRKAHCAAARLKRLNREVAVQVHDQRLCSTNILATIADYDFVIDASDTMATKLLINDACVMGRKAFSHAGAAEFGGQTMTVIPTESACLRCLLGDATGDDSPTCAEAGVLGAVVGVFGALQALEAIKVVCGLGMPLINMVLTFDALSLQFQRVAVSRRSDCPVCGESPTIRDLSEDRATRACTRG